MKHRKWIIKTAGIMAGIMVVSGVPCNIYAEENNEQIEKENRVQETDDENDENLQKNIVRETSDVEDTVKESSQDLASNNEVQEKELQEAEKNDEADSWRYQSGELITQETTNQAGRRKVARSARTIVPWTNINGNFYNSLGQKIDGVVAKGIDVSEHNGQIDWNKVKNTDVNYAIIRCGYGMNQTEQDDKKWSYNVSECERLGIPYGVYLYSYADSTQKAVSEAQHVLRLIEGRHLTYPIYYDLEENKVRSKVSQSDIAKIATAFCDTIESAGYSVGIYANTDWFTNYLTDVTFSNYKKWVAQYNYTCTYSGVYTMWQCTSKGSVDGITTDVDLNMDFGKSNDIDGKALIKNEEGTYCYQNGNKLYGEQNVNGKWYYFDKRTGAMQTGLYNLGNKVVYYGTDGAMRYGEQNVNGKWYYFDKRTGAMKNI